jgi:acyl carrier protein
MFSEHAEETEAAASAVLAPVLAEDGDGSAAAWRSQAELRGFLESSVAASVRSMLGGDVAADAPLMDAGLDSLGAVELKNALERTVGLDLPATLTFDYPTTGALVGFLESQMIADGRLQQGAVAAVVAPSFGRELAPTTRAVMESPLVVLACASQPMLGEEGAGPVRSIRDASCRVPFGRWDVEAHSRVLEDPAPAFSCFVRGVELFDGQLLGVADAEGLLMDPQQRLLLETVSELWASVREDNGAWADGTARAGTGVFVGVSSTDYSMLVQKHVSGVSAFMGTGACYADRLRSTCGVSLI